MDWKESYEDYRELLQKREHLESYRDILCECFCVSTQDIKEHVERTKCFDGQKVMADLNIGRGCGTCREAMSKWIDAYLSIEG